MESIEVIAKLAEVAEEWREKRLGKRLPFHAVARESSVGDDAIRKFEGGEQGRNIDRMANAYATAFTKAGLETSVFDLWDEAIRRARAAEMANANGQAPVLDPNSPAGEAAAAAEEAERKAKARQRASRRGRKKSG